MVSRGAVGAAFRVLSRSPKRKCPSKRHSYRVFHLAESKGIYELVDATSLDSGPLAPGSVGIALKRGLFDFIDPQAT
ncbi:hypothetical protein BH18ACI4_BH18ACI4_04810 [soil metagenome]